MGLLVHLGPVLRLIAVRLLAAVPVLLVVSLVSFGMTLLVPGDMAAELAGPSATAADIARLRASLGLDQPMLGRMLAWYMGLAQGDLGRSVLLNQSVAAAILERLPVTLSLRFLTTFRCTPMLVPQCRNSLAGGSITEHHEAGATYDWPDLARLARAPRLDPETDERQIGNPAFNSIEGGARPFDA